MIRRHFESEAERRAFLAVVVDDYRNDAAEWDMHETATALYDDHDPCPWNITTHLDPTAPYDELSGLDSCVRNKACLSIESLLAELYADAAD